MDRFYRLIIPVASLLRQDRLLAWAVAKLLLR
jgi:hypothetical protein